jgi:hypothetical protein
VSDVLVQLINLRCYLEDFPTLQVRFAADTLRQGLFSSKTGFVRQNHLTPEGGRIEIAEELRGAYSTWGSASACQIGKIDFVEKLWQQSLRCDNCSKEIVHQFVSEQIDRYLSLDNGKTRLPG